MKTVVYLILGIPMVIAFIAFYVVGTIVMFLINYAISIVEAFVEALIETCAVVGESAIMIWDAFIRHLKETRK